MARVVNYCFTLNNYSDAEVISIQSIGAVKFIGYGKEVGESGTPHLQGIVCFTHAKTFGAAKKSFPSRVHLETMRGTVEQAWLYCIKDGDIWSSGVRPRSASEVGLLNKERFQEFLVCAKANNTTDVDQVMYVMYYSTFHRIAAAHLKAPDNLDSVCGVWIHGKSRAGKSHAVNARHPDAYRKMNNKWWEAYQGQDVIWMDDIDPDSTSWIARFLKIWADKWSFLAEIKGSAMMVRPKRFIITSNYTIEQMGFRPADLEPILARFIQIEKIKGQDIIL